LRWGIPCLLGIQAKRHTLERRIDIAKAGAMFVVRQSQSPLMMDANALERLEHFVVRHGRCGQDALSTEFVEDGDSGGIHVIKRCQACNAMTLATVTKGAAKALLR
jgi:hypothetical protein